MFSHLVTPSLCWRLVFLSVWTEVAWELREMCVCLFFCVLDVTKREWILEVKQNKMQEVSMVYNEMACFMLREISVYVGTTETSVCMRWFLFIMTLELVNQHSQPSASTHFLSKCVCLEHCRKNWAPNLTSRNTHLARSGCVLWLSQ